MNKEKMYTSGLPWFELSFHPNWIGVVVEGVIIDGGGQCKDQTSEQN